MENKKAHRIRESYDLTAPYYDSRYKELQHGKYQILKSININENMGMLDAGCGTGLLFSLIPQMTMRVGLDISMNMLHQAQKNVLRYNGGKDIQLVAGSLDAMPFRGQYFDIIASFTAIQNLQHPNKGIQECDRVLRRKGRLLVTVLRKSIHIEELRKWCEERNLIKVQSWGEVLEDAGIYCIKDKEKENATLV